MRTRATGLATLALLALAAAPLRAEVQTFAYHDGSGEGAIQGLDAGEAEAFRFSPEHPAVFHAVRLWLAGEGEADVYLWADNGGLQPDLERPFAGPFRVTAVEGAPVEVALDGLRIDPPQAVFVGIVHTGALPALLVDADGPHEPRSLVYAYVDDYGKSLWQGLDGTFMVEADVEYVAVVPPAERWFVDATEAAGITPGRRVAWVDYDGDGDPDLCFQGRQLYRNEGDGTFTDVTEAAGLGSAPSNGGVWADYDNDGDLDLYATVSSFESDDPERHDRLYRNEGDGTFTDVSAAAGAPYDDLPTEAAAWGDYDGDGFVDLYVANYEQPGDTLAIGTADFLYRNEGDGTFRDVSEEAGIRAVWNQCGRGVAWADFDQDGDLDIYVSNYRLDANFLWVNQGDGTFREESRARGVQGVPQGSGFDPAYGHTIGSVWGDLDLDGDLDLVAANLAHPRFIEFSDKTMVYRAKGAPDWTFEDVRAEAGVAYAETHSSVDLGDIDNDGDLDLFVTSVYEDRTSFLYRNEHVPAPGAGDGGGIAFTDVNYPSGAVVMNGWGAAFADYDGDGDLDLCAGRLLRNDGAVAAGGSGGNWIALKLEGTTSNRAAVGARVAVSAGGRVHVRQVGAGMGTGCQAPLVQHVGLGSVDAVHQVVVRWPSGLREIFTGPFPAGQRLTLVEGASLAPPPPDVVGGDGDTVGADTAGADGAAPPPDALADATPDALLDAGAAPDGAADASPADSDDGGGSGCAATGRPSPAALPLLVALLALLAVQRAFRARIVRTK